MINNSIVNNFENGVDTMINTDATEEIVMNTEVTTNTNDVPQPFPAPLAQPATPDAPASDPPAQTSTTTPTQASTTTAPSSYRARSGEDYFNDGSFDQDCAEYKLSYKSKTGFDNIDGVSGFGVGLYAIGAGSSMGKTTFCMQLADQQAAMGKHVMYFAQEQSEHDLYPKSLARGSFLEHEADKAINGHSNIPCYSNDDVRENNMDSNDKSHMIDEYLRTVGNRVHISEGCFGRTIEDICNEIQKFMDETGEKPVVILDYLQALKASTVNGRSLEGKASIDHIVLTLKTFQMRNRLTVILISSLNRSNYTLPIDYESFKESGSIEYTADVVWGLQLHILSLDGFYRRVDTQKGGFGKDTNTKEKREMIRKAKATLPRRMELVCLKNRYGKATYSVEFNYYPNYETFIPI